MNTNKRIRFTEPIVKYRDSNEATPSELHNTRLESLDIVRSIDRGSVVEGSLVGKPILECGDNELIDGYDGGDFYNGILYSSIRGNCGTVVATPCSFDGDREYCPPQITNIATIEVTNAANRLFPDGLSSVDGNHGIGRGRYVSYIFVPVNNRGEYGLAQYYYFINPSGEDSGYDKYTAPIISIGVSEDVDYVEAYRTLEKDINTGLPVENNYYYMGNYYRSLTKNLLRNVVVHSGFTKNANDNGYNCFFYDKDDNFIDIKSLLSGVEYDFRIDQDWNWDNGTTFSDDEQLNYMWIRGRCQLVDSNIEQPLPVGTKFRFSNLPKGSILDETRTYFVTDSGEFRSDQAGDELCNCWDYYFRFDKPTNFDYIRDVLAGDDIDAYNGYYKLAYAAGDTVITMTEAERDAIYEREENPSSITLFPSDDETIDDSEYNVKVFDYNRWNTTLSTLVEEQTRAPVTTEERKRVIQQWEANTGQEFPDTVSHETSDLIEEAALQQRLNDLSDRAGVSTDVILDDAHLPPSNALIYSEVRKPLAFGLKKEICIKQS